MEKSVKKYWPFFLIPTVGAFVIGFIIPFIEGKLFLKVNRKKTKVAHISKVKYLGYTYYRYEGTTKRN